ncbi:MAG TPA: RecX family transcriptional regulator [Novosphingobium sp.]|nr:RecX family transcriptional regulator [Novosphingobium sp.]HNN55085.1 RecX family transcriptional regulator [Novosphingobium sp.]
MTRPRRNSRPLDPARLEELALGYAARFATSAAKLEAYLTRKLRERGWEHEQEPRLSALIERFAAMGYIDDAAYARARTSSLLRRGYGPRRIAQALGAAGIDEEVRATERAGEAEERRAALAFARRRGFGPFGEKLPDRAQREKQLAAMLRAGHRLDSARELVDAPDLSTVEAWASEKDDGE